MWLGARSLEWEGQKRPVVLHAPKNGFLYVLDRRDGKVLAAHSITYQNWANGVDLTTGRPNLTPDGTIEVTFATTDRLSAAYLAGRDGFRHRLIIMLPAN